MYKKESIHIKIFIAVFFGICAVIYLCLSATCLERFANANKINDDYDIDGYTPDGK